MTQRDLVWRCHTYNMDELHARASFAATVRVIGYKIDRTVRVSIDREVLSRRSRKEKNQRHE